MRSALRRLTLGLGMVALASPVLLLTDPTRQREVADRLSPAAQEQQVARPVRDVPAERARR